MQHDEAWLSAGLGGIDWHVRPPLVWSARWRSAIGTETNPARNDATDSMRHPASPSCHAPDGDFQNVNPGPFAVCLRLPSVGALEPSDRSQGPGCPLVLQMPRRAPGRSRDVDPFGHGAFLSRRQVLRASRFPNRQKAAMARMYVSGPNVERVVVATTVDRARSRGPSSRSRCLAFQCPAKERYRAARL